MCYVVVERMSDASSTMTLIESFLILRVGEGVIGGWGVLMNSMKDRRRALSEENVGTHLQSGRVCCGRWATTGVNIWRRQRREMFIAVGELDVIENWDWDEGTYR